MVMNHQDEQLLQNFSMERNLKKQTLDGYRVAIKLYTDFQGSTFNELIQEALNEEAAAVPWKKSKLRQRLINFRLHLMNKGLLFNTVKGYVSRIQTLYAEGFDVDIGKLPNFNQKNIRKPIPLNYRDLPNKEIIKEALHIATPLMRAVILFMTSSGCAKRETLNLTIQDFIDATREYHYSNNIYEVIGLLKARDDVVPTWNLIRQKTNKYYTTFSSPESTDEILSYLITEERELLPQDSLFKITATHFNNTFGKLNADLGLGKAGTYNRFRSHMLRKFHASQLYNDGLSLDEVDSLQGRGKNSTRESYFMDDPIKLRKRYIDHMDAISINYSVKNLDVKSKEYEQLEVKNNKLNHELDYIKDRLYNLERNDTPPSRRYGSY